MKEFIAALLVLTFGAATALAVDHLPVKDGVYISGGTQRCAALKRGELDFVDYMVRKGGRVIGMPEVGCLVATVRQVRKGRYFVEADCHEAGVEAPWQWSQMIDVTNGRISVEGEDYDFCPVEFDEDGYLIITDGLHREANGGEGSPKQKGSGSTVPGGSLSMHNEPADVGRIDISSLSDPNVLIDLWHEENEICRGSSDPDAAETIAACARRADINARLDGLGWCYAEESQSRSQYVWHRCGQGSIR